jgi:hypothetical protein
LNFTTDALKMSGYNSRSIPIPKIAYQLKVDLAVHLVCKKKRNFRGERQKAITQEVDKLQVVGFIREVLYPT